MGVWVEGRETSFVIPRNKTEESVLGGREGEGGGGGGGLWFFVPGNITGKGWKGGLVRDSWVQAQKSGCWMPRLQFLGTKHEKHTHKNNNNKQTNKNPPRSSFLGTKPAKAAEKWMWVAVGGGGGGGRNCSLRNS